MVTSTLVWLGHSRADSGRFKAVVRYATVTLISVSGWWHRCCGGWILTISRLAHSLGAGSPVRVWRACVLPSAGGKEPAGVT